MRRTFGGIAIALGVALLILGLGAKPFLYDQLAVVPLDQKSTSVSEGKNMSVLRVWGEDLGEGKVQAHFDQLTDATVRSTRTVVGIPGAVPADQRDTTAVWQTGVKSVAVGVGDLTFSNEIVTFDRRTALTTGAPRDQQSTGDLADPTKMEPVTHSGLFFKFPFGVEKKTYPFWDGDLSKAVDIKFVREEQLLGTTTYVFEQVIPQTEVPPAVTVPAAVFGATGADVQATTMYGSTRTLWVEPNTGVILKGQEQPDKSLVSSLGTVVTTKGTIGYTDATVRDNVDAWGTKGALLGFIHGALLPIGVVAGLILIAIGALLLRRRPEAPSPSTTRSGRASGVGATRAG